MYGVKYTLTQVHIHGQPSVYFKRNEFSLVLARWSNFLNLKKKKEKQTFSFCMCAWWNVDSVQNLFWSVVVQGFCAYIHGDFVCSYTCTRHIWESNEWFPHIKSGVIFWIWVLGFILQSWLVGESWYIGP